MNSRQRKKVLPHRNCLVPLLMKKTGGGKHRSKKKDLKDKHDE